MWPTEWHDEQNKQNNDIYDIMFRVEEQIVLLCFMLEAISSVKVYMKQDMSKKCGH